MYLHSLFQHLDGFTCESIAPSLHSYTVQASLYTHTLGTCVVRAGRACHRPLYARIHVEGDKAEVTSVIVCETVKL